MSKPLYELTKELAEINDQLITNEGEITPDLEARLDQVQLAVEQKATGIRKWMVMIESDGKAIKSEIDRLMTLQRLNTNLETRLETYVKKNMEAAGLKQIKTQIGTFTITKSPDSVEVISEEMVPDEFKRTIPERKEVDKTKIKGALQDGYDVPGVKLITDRTHLRIK